MFVRNAAMFYVAQATAEIIEYARERYTCSYLLPATLAGFLSIWN